MCLNYLTTSQPLVAKKDIVCYKQVIKINYPQGGPIAHGAECIAIINVDGVKHTVKGKISVLWNGFSLCHDYGEFTYNGTFSSSSDKFGFRFVRPLNDQVESLIIDNVECIKTIYVTPYRWSPVKIGENYTSILSSPGTYGRINKGLHSYARKPRIADKGCIIAKCIIPKGALYYRGKFGGMVSFASNSLTYLEIVE